MSESVDQLELQLRALFEHWLPIVFAPAFGALFTTWVLWEYVEQTTLMYLTALVILISLFRAGVYQVYVKRSAEELLGLPFRNMVIGTSLASGILWGSFAFLIYPTVDLDYEKYMIILLSLVPIAPAAALSTYLPAFYAYYVPATSPFVMVLLFERSRDGWTSAVLLIILMIATIQFANRFHVGLLEAHTLRREAARAARKLNDNLRSKTRFMIEANHDLRQPLQALQLSLGKAGDELTDQQVNTARLAASALEEYLERLREVSQFEGVSTADLQHISLGDFLEKIVEIFRPIAGQKGLAIKYVKTSVWVSASPIALKVILQNLLSNAISHAAHADRVLIGCRRQGNSVVIHVIDNGPGIKTDQHERIFWDFVQLNNPVRDRELGMGLGLSIAQRAAISMGAVISVDSNLGAGTDFSLKLIQVACPDFGGSILPEEIMSSPSQRIVVVDGEEMLRKSLESRLIAKGHLVKAFGSSNEALAYARETPDIDFAIVDFRLDAEMDGFQLINAFRSAIDEDLSCVIVTGDTDSSIAVRAENNECYFLLKPFDIKDIETILLSIS